MGEDGLVLVLNCGSSSIKFAVFDTAIRPREHGVQRHGRGSRHRACASVICSDKTGTLTRAEMTVQRVMTASGETRITGLGYAPPSSTPAARSKADPCWPRTSRCQRQQPGEQRAIAPGFGRWVGSSGRPVRSRCEWPPRAGLPRLANEGTSHNSPRVGSDIATDLDRRQESPVSPVPCWVLTDGGRLCPTAV